MKSNQPPKFNPKPVTLEGEHARLEPLSDMHAPDLYEAGNIPAIWRYLPADPLSSVEDVRQRIAEAQEASREGREVPFAIIHKESGKAIGSTRYMDVQRMHRGLEIGWTWITPAHQRSAVNTECKLLLLRHAFEEQGAIRVYLKTDSRNTRSQDAILRIGAVYEGVLRNHYLLSDGYKRDTVIFSVTDDEWPAVKERLSGMLGK